MVVLFCSLAVLDPRVGHTMDVLSPFIPVLCHSDWLFHGESCPRLGVVHPGRAWSSSPAFTWHCSLHYLFLQWECSHWKSANWIELTCVKLTQFHDALLVSVLTKSISAHWSSVQFVCCEHGLKSLSSASFNGCQHESLLLSAVLRHHYCWAPGARCCRSIYPACRALSYKPAARHCCGRLMGQTDGQTDTRPLHRPCCAYYVSGANKTFCRLSAVFSG